MDRPGHTGEFSANVRDASAERPVVRATDRWSCLHVVGTLGAFCESTTLVTVDTFRFEVSNHGSSVQIGAGLGVLEAGLRPKWGNV